MKRAGEAEGAEGAEGVNTEFQSLKPFPFTLLLITTNYELPITNYQLLGFVTCADAFLKGWSLGQLANIFGNGGVHI